jgi:S1-C subfamily serine protease
VSTLKSFGCAILLLVASLVTTAHAQLSEAEENDIRTVQYLLLWTLDFQGQLDGQLSPVMQQAVRDFQRRIGGQPNGVLDQSQIHKLYEDAKSAVEKAGYVYVVDAATGASVALPQALFTATSRIKSGFKYATSDSQIEVVTHQVSDLTLTQMYRSLLDPLDKSGLMQNSFRGSSFILSWATGNYQTVVRYDDHHGEVRGIKIKFDRNTRSSFYPLAVAMINDFLPFSEPAPLPLLKMPSVKSFSTAPAPGPTPKEPMPPRRRRDSGAAVTISSGTGFVVSSKGHILTNAHVVEDCTKISTEGQSNLKLVGVDQRNDLALLLPPTVGAVRVAKFAAEAVRLGEDVAAFGFPLRGILAERLNITTGVVSSMAGLQGDPKFFQISAPVQRGNSGGPVVDFSGRVVGIVTSKLDAIEINRVSGDLPQVVNFAIRHELAISFMRRNGVEPETSPPGEPIRKTDLASEAAAYTLPITCERSGPRR